MEKCGQLPPGVAGYGAGALTQAGFYAFCDALVMMTDTFENLPRVGMESMASGTVLIVDDRGGWQTLVENGVTGFLCKGLSDVVAAAERLASERGLMHEMASAALARLEQRWGFLAAAASWERVLA